MASRSRSRYRGSSSNPPPNSCCAVQAAVGCSVALTCTIRRRSWLRMTRTKRIRKVAVGTVKKSNAIVSFTRFARNVRHPWDGGPKRLIMYLESVASEMYPRAPSLDAAHQFTLSRLSFNSSPWIRGAPHNGLARHMRRIRYRIAGSILGRPRGRLFQRQ